MKLLRRGGPAVLTILVAVTANGALAAHQHGGAAPAGEKPIPLFEDLGNYHRPVGTSSPEAQAYFDQGMMLAYAFGRPQAVRSFRAAAELDPDCAICYWGMAWALGPYQNEKMTADNAPRAYAASREALAREDAAGEWERALIEAMAVRYVEEPKEDRATLDRAYADAMKTAAERFPDDPDVNALYAESLMVLHPWDLYPGGRVRPEAEEAIAVLEKVLAGDIRHAGACHLYIHSVEESSTPERAESCADLLAAEIPLGSHIQHMPSHVYMRIGRYGDAVRANQQARIVDRKAANGEAVAIYPRHNTAMLCFAGWMDGQSSVALQAARDLGDGRGRDAMMVPLMLARFGRWTDLERAGKVPNSGLPGAMWQFARGLAFLRTGESKQSERALGRLRRIIDGTNPAETIDPDSTTRPVDLMHIAAGLLAGEIAAAAGDFDAAVDDLEKAVAVEDGLEYSEPEIWPIPSRQVLGAILLEAGRPQEAERVYREELRDHRENGWSLFGLAAALRAQGREAEAAAVRERFERAWARADVALESSRF